MYKDHRNSQSPFRKFCFFTRSRPTRPLEKLAHREVAVKYGLNTGLVQRLVSEDRKDP